MKPFSLSVPASSANIGPGFDSLGLAVDLYLNLTVSANNTWGIDQQSEMLPAFNNYKEHFIYQVANQTAALYGKELPACYMTINSAIPLARGLGSSASAIVAGIELANQCCQLGLSSNEKLQLATEREGHPDNVAAALLGGLVVTAYNDDKSIDVCKINQLNIDILVFIPQEELKTDVSRQVLPEVYSRSQAAKAGSIGNVFIAALMNENYELAGKMMEKDIFHEPFRAKLIAKYDAIKRMTKELGAYGTVISGAGPTMLSFFPKGTGAAIKQKLQNTFSSYHIQQREIDFTGVRVETKLV
ncbi:MULTISPECIES: homoserine kinase [unclassified Virgibacillus]|uniref:homoserine kinase n=1 Tax=unclassified Virgibacillus TaxID=2620237 RepID=UPI00090A1B8A|nr:MULTISPECIES: homoserine kinase [unclassified Virgibacillus]API92791.1 homoserine kinase [Virgibacillus sp. 6R]MBS7428298.1 homoserine kinase [Virgibacillus sp. 19R1-5]